MTSSLAQERALAGDGLPGEAVPKEGPRFECIYAEYFPFVWRCLSSLGVPAGALDDAAQDVFLVAHRRLGEFEGRSTVRTWLFGIVRNVASNRRRGMARNPSRAPDTVETAALDPGPHEVAQDGEAADFVRTFLSTLDAAKRDVFVLAVLEEMSVPDAAEALSIPLNTAYTRLRRVRAEFRRALEREEEEP